MNNKTETVVYVCPERDIECGNIISRWCTNCPQWNISGNRNFTSPAPAPVDQLTDAQIEHIFLSYLGKWNGSEWQIEDANLHPFVRDCLAQSARQGACDVLDAARWRFAVNFTNEESPESIAMESATDEFEDERNTPENFTKCVDLAMQILKAKNDN